MSGVWCLAPTLHVDVPDRVSGYPGPKHSSLSTLPMSVLLPGTLSLSARFKLSQSAASLENRVPTPASVASADLHSQHAVADLPVQENKAEVRHVKQEFEPVSIKNESKTEVSFHVEALGATAPIYWRCSFSTLFIVQECSSPLSLIVFQMIHSRTSFILLSCEMSVCYKSP